MLAIYITDKGLEFRMYKEITKINRKKTNNPIKWAKKKKKGKKVQSFHLRKQAARKYKMFNLTKTQANGN